MEKAIDSKLPAMHKELEAIAGLSWPMAVANFKLKNEGSYLGIMWYLLSPLLLFTILYYIFSTRVGNAIPQYPLYLLTGLIIFNFFQSTASGAIKAITSKSGLIKKTKLPLESFVISHVTMAAFSHMIEIALIVALILFIGTPSWTIILLPIFFAIFASFVLGISLLLATIGVYFSDFNNIWLIFSRLLWFATPVFYSIEGQASLQTVNKYNPMYYFLTVARDILVYSRIPEPKMIAVIILSAAMSLLAGWFSFRKFKEKFAEII